VIRRIVPLVGLLAGVLLIVTTTVAQSWFVAGDALVGDDGTWEFDQIVPVDLIEEGLTYVRVTSGPCNGSPDTYVVYEANLTPPPAGDDAWSGSLEPTGAKAEPISRDADDPDVAVIQGGNTSTVRIMLPGQTPNITITACFTHPSQ